MTRVTAADILKVVPITRKTLWLWQKKYKFFPDPVKEAHPGGKGIVGYYPAWVEERCKKVYALQKKGYTISMIQEILQQEKENQSARKILIVDDEKKFSNLLKKFFEKNNFVVELAFDGWDAGLKAAQFMPSIIILDIALPGINGMEVCKNLNDNSKTANIKVIAISGDLRHSEKVILDAGAEIYFTKPVDFDTLLTVCNEFVGQVEST
jgi:CheY-like chemotaxis protein